MVRATVKGFYATRGTFEKNERRATDMICSKCGLDVGEVKFCPRCGSSVIQETSPIVKNRPPQAVQYETTWKNEKPKRIRESAMSLSNGSIVRLVFGTITTVGAAYAILYAFLILSFSSIGAILRGLEYTGTKLIAATALMLTGGILMLSTRWSKSGGIVSGVILILSAVVAMFADDQTGFAVCIALISGVSGAISIVVSAIWGGTGSHI